MTRAITSLIILALILAGFWFFYPRSQPAVVTGSQTSGSSAVGSQANEKWHDFTAPQGKFHVRLPALPHHATETVKDSETQENRLYDFFLASKGDGTIFAVNTITFPEKKEGYDEAFLRNFMQQMLTSNPMNKVKSMEAKPYHNHQALDFKVENAEVTIDGKAFFDDNTLYILSTTARNDIHNSQEFENFTNSFELAPKGKK